MRSATSFTLERYADERLLSGLAPGAELTSPRPDAGEEGGKDPRSSLLEVRFEDLVRALREVNPTGTRARRRGALASLSSRLCGWRRERAKPKVARVLAFAISAWISGNSNCECVFFAHFFLRERASFFIFNFANFNLF